MSEQLKFEDIIQGWEAFLKGSPTRRYIRIKNLDTNRWVHEQSKVPHPTMFTLEDIKKTHSGIGPWFDDLLVRHNLSKIQVVFRKKMGGNGSQGVPQFKDTEYIVSNRLATLKNNNHRPMETATQEPVKTMMPDPVKSLPIIPLTGLPAPAAPTPFAPLQQTQNSYSPQPGAYGLSAATMAAMGGLGQAALSAGMGIPELIEVKKKAERADEYKDEVSRLKVENESLVIKNRDLDSKVANAEQSKDIAVQLAKLENKGFMDSQGVQKILETLPAYFQMMAGNSGQAPAQAPGLNAPNLSPEKAKFIGYLDEPSLTPETLLLLENALVLLITQPQYKQELQQINSKEYANGNNG